MQQEEEIKPYPKQIRNKVRTEFCDAGDEANISIIVENDVDDIDPVTVSQ